MPQKWIVSISALILLPLVLYSAPPEKLSEKPIPPKRFQFQKRSASLETVLGELKKQTGIEISASKEDLVMTRDFEFKNAAFWNVAESLASQLGRRVAISKQGTVIRLSPAREEKPIVSVAGPFRVSAREIVIRNDFETGRSTYNLTVDVNWEPRFTVFRMDDKPRITSSKDDAGKDLQATYIDSRTPVSGFASSSTITINGLTRKSQSIAELKGHFTATVAEEMLSFVFNDLKPTAVAATQNEVEVRLKVEKEGNFWTAEVNLKYPPGGPEFESFETYWLKNNSIHLIPPGKNVDQAFTTTNYEILGVRDGAIIRYRFKEDKKAGLTLEDPKGWKVQYRTPGVMRDVSIPFELHNIPLP